MKEKMSYIIDGSKTRRIKGIIVNNYMPANWIT
jgi:hypothetical protein